MEALQKNLRIIEVGGKTYLGIPVARGKGLQSFIRLFSSEDRKGLILTERSIEEWEIVGFSEVDGTLYLYGTPFDSLPEPFTSLLDTPPGFSIPPRWVLFIRRLDLLGKTSKIPEKLYPEGMFFLKKGGILLLPEKLMQKILALEPIDRRIAYFNSFNHPDLTGEENCVFFLATVTYRLITGFSPFVGTTEEELHTEMRYFPPLPATLKRPGLDEELSDFLQLFLIMKEKLSLSEWVQKIEHFSKQPLMHSLTREEMEKKAKETERFLSQRKSSHRRRTFWMKHRTHVILASLLTLVGGYFVYDVLSNALRPPRTVGMPPEQVVNLFYTSMNTLDHQAMEDCVKGKAGKAYINEVTQLYVVSRMRMSVEFKSGMLDAESWYRKGRPPLQEGVTLYGIAELKIDQEVGQDPSKINSRKEKEPEVRQFLVQFHRWVPDPPSEGNLRFRGYQIEERVILQKEGEGWVIVEILPLQATPLPPPSFE